MANNISIKKLMLKSGILFCLATPIGSVLASGDDGHYENSYTPENHVASADTADFASGKLGVVPSSYWRVYQFLAYRAMTGQPVSPADVTSLNLNGGYKVGTINTPDQLSEKGLSDWLAARKQVKGVGDLPKSSRINVYGNAGNYGSYYACPANAFNTATRALAARLKTSEVNAKIWLAGQDAVFENCSPPRPWLDQKVENDARIAVVLPAVLPKNTPQWMIYDRDYQVAAANFYAEKYDAARSQFLAIANTKVSPWQPLGSYLAARCLIRKATLYYTPAEGTMDVKQAEIITHKGKDLLTKAKAELITISKTYAPAKSLISFVDAQLHPYERMQELGSVLATGKVDPQQLTDYLLLLDKTERNQDNTKMMQATDPMTAWIGSMQAPLDGIDYLSLSDAAKIKDLRLKALNISRKKWQKDPNQLAWLAPLISHAKVNELTSTERKAISSVASNSPVYETLQYHLARIAITEKKLDDADEIVTKVLTNNTPNMSHATHNRWFALKVITAKTEAEFLKALPRQVAEAPIAVPIPNETAGSKASSEASSQAMMPQFDSDFNNRIYHDFSLADLKIFLANKDFPAKSLSPYLNLKEVIWTRAIIFGDYATADALTGDLMVGRETTKGLFERYKAAQTPDEKKIAAMLILVNVPELHPAIVEDVGSLRTWGCGYGNASGGDYGYDQTLSDVATPLNFMKKDAIDAAKKERTQLFALPLRSEYLAPTLLAWAKQNPKDVEAPKALHFFVASTRMECPYGNIHPIAKTNYSKAAFDLLHKNYPKSDWAEKTKYFFKAEPRTD